MERGQHGRRNLGGPVEVTYGRIGKMEQRKNPLTPERRLMNEALARIGQSGVKETRGAARRSGRLVFALDLTASREPGLHEARIATGAMFDALKAIDADSLTVKLVYYRGRECKATNWEHDPGVLRRAMENLSCQAGNTQIARVLRLALAEKEPVSGVVLIADVYEENPRELADLAATLGDRNIPLFVFHDYSGRNVQGVEAAGPVFQYMAELSHGAYCQFGTGSAAALRELLSTVAAFSTAGIEGVKQVQKEVTSPEARELQSRLLLLGPDGGNLEKRR